MRMTQKNQPLLDALLSRRSVPVSLLGEPGPSESEIELLLTIAGRIPDHGRLEPWRFSLMHGDARLKAGEKIAARALELDPALSAEDQERERTRFGRAPLVVLVISRTVDHPRIPQWEQFLSAGAAAMNLLYGAMALGYGASWITGWYSDDVEGRRILGLSDEERIAGIVHIGSYDNAVPERPRPDMAAIVSDYVVPDGAP